MKPVAFDYPRPRSLEEALAKHADAASVLGGGQSLMPMLNMRLAQPSLLVDIAALDDALDAFAVDLDAAAALRESKDV